MDEKKKKYFNKNIITILFFLNTLSLSLYIYTHYVYTFLQIWAF